mmetsp:Transcript_11271/g.22193  ORF Transcript_11271/g.22193 Transcript_11271/m.22193 type:complete len:83 (-) Transcript_11271:171-419(-)
MLSPYKIDVLRLYRRFWKVLISKPIQFRTSLADQVRTEFKAGAKVSIKDLKRADQLFNHGKRWLEDIRGARIERVSKFIPKR